MPWLILFPFSPGIEKNITLKKTLFFVGIALLSFAANAQNKLSVKVFNATSKGALEGVSISANNKAVAATDKNGNAILQLMAG